MTDVATIEPDPLDEPWCCLTCTTKFTIGKVWIVTPDKKHPLGLSCPTCRDGLGLYPMNGTQHVLDDYRGDDIPERLS